jgi:hypothetical protein
VLTASRAPWQNPFARTITTADQIDFLVGTGRADEQIAELEDTARLCSSALSSVVEEETVCASGASTAHRYALPRTRALRLHAEIWRVSATRRCSSRHRSCRSEPSCSKTWTHSSIGAQVTRCHWDTRSIARVFDANLTALYLNLMAR